jgi:hypothetical protein
VSPLKMAINPVYPVSFWCFAVMCLDTVMTKIVQIDLTNDRTNQRSIDGQMANSTS